MEKISKNHFASPPLSKQTYPVPGLGLLKGKDIYECGVQMHLGNHQKQARNYRGGIKN
jgi:hypothetical protein